MKEMFGEFKKVLNAENESRLYEKLSEVKESLKEQFVLEFPDLEEDLFLKSKRWLEMVGTGHDDRFSEDVPTEVEVWVTRQLTALIESV